MAHRVWVVDSKTFEVLGDRRWEVQWYTVTQKAYDRVHAAEAKGELDEYDPDRDIVYHTKAFRYSAKGPAVAYAKKMAQHPLNAYGSAMLQEQVVDWYVEEDNMAEWADVGESVEY